MIFLIEYDRAAGTLVQLRSFDDMERDAAAQARLALELTLQHDGVEREVVLLEATDESALRKTHRRYFEGLQELTVPAER